MTGQRNDDMWNNEGRSAGQDPELTELLRKHYAAPGDQSYWLRQEQRIMQAIPAILRGAVRELRPRWWSGFAELKASDLRTAGLIAATLALLATGATFVRNQTENARARAIAARAVVESTQPLDDIMLTRVRTRLPADAPERYLDPLDY